MNVQVVIAFFAYFFILLCIGLFSHKRSTSSADFIMGNRSLNFWLTAFTAHAADMSAWLFMAFPAAVFIGGLSQAWLALGLLCGMYLNWQFIAQKLRIATEKYHSYTLSTFFERRFSDHTGLIRTLTALMSIIFLTIYLSAGLIGMGLLLESLFGINYYLGLTIATLVVVTYTFVGGFVTVAWTDSFQAVFLLSIILLVPIVALSHIGGWEPVVNAAQTNQIDLRFLPDHSWQTILGIISLVLGWGLGYFGQPHIITKFMGINHSSELRKSKYIGMGWEILALSAAALIGIIGIGFYPEGLANPELVFVEMVKQLFHPLVSGFMLCAVLAATMSTMDSQILVCASVLSEDLYKHIFHKSATSKDLLTASRIGVIAISLFSLLLSFGRSSTILDTVQYAWSGLGCSFGPLVIMSLYYSKANKYGAIAGILIGGFISGVWPAINPYITSFVLPSMIPGFFLSLLSIWIVSLITEGKKPATV